MVVPFFDFVEAGFYPIEFLCLVVVVGSVHDGQEGFVIDNVFVVFIHVVEKVFFFIVGEDDDFVEIF